MTTLREAAQRALEFLDAEFGWSPGEAPRIDALRAALAQQAEPLNLRDPAVQKRLATQWGYVPAAQAEPVAWVGDPSTQDYASTQPEPDAYGYASRLAFAIWNKHYKDTAPQWKPFDDLMGVLTQIDNMTSGLTRLAQQDEPVLVQGELPPRYVARSPIQAEPVEPVAGVVLNEEGRAALVEHGREEWHCVSRNARRLYTAPPQRKPLTEEVAALTAQRDALLEALNDIANTDHVDAALDPQRAVRIARAAIKAVEGGA